MNIYKGYYKLRPPVNWQIENKFRKFCFSLYVLYLRYMYLYVSFRKKRSHRRYTSLFMTGIPCLHYTNVDFSYAPLQTTQCAIIVCLENVFKEGFHYLLSRVWVFVLFLFFFLPRVIFFKSVGVLQVQKIIDAICEIDFACPLSLYFP